MAADGRALHPIAPGLPPAWGSRWDHKLKPHHGAEADPVAAGIIVELSAIDATALTGAKAADRLGNRK
jgi:hypothetical protein